MLFQLSYSPSSKVEWNDKDSTFEKNLHNWHRFPGLVFAGDHWHARTVQLSSAQVTKKKQPQQKKKKKNAGNWLFFLNLLFVSIDEIIGRSYWS